VSNLYVCMQPFYPATWLTNWMPVLDTAELLPDRPGPMSC